MYMYFESRNNKQKVCCPAHVMSGYSNDGSQVRDDALLIGRLLGGNWFRSKQTSNSRAWSAWYGYRVCSGVSVVEKSGFHVLPTLPKAGN